MPQFLLYTYMENVSVLSYSVESELGLRRKRREKCGANCFKLIRFGAQSEFHDRKCIKKKKKKKKRKESEAQSPVSFDYLFFVLLLFPLFVHNKYLTSTPPFLFLYRIKMEDSLFPYVYISLRDCLHKREVEGTRQKEKRERERERVLCFPLNQIRLLWLTPPEPVVVGPYVPPQGQTALILPHLLELFGDRTQTETESSDLFIRRSHSPRPYSDGMIVDFSEVGV